MADSTRVYTKSILVTLSHAIERFALAAEDGPTLVVALFQRLAYFEREFDVYEELARRCNFVLVAVAEDFPPALPEGVRHVLLRPGEDLCRTWGVIALTPTAGATLRCTDLETVEPNAPTLEAGRRFFGTWSFRRQDAYADLIQLRSELRERLTGEHLDRMDEVLEQVLAHTTGRAELMGNAALRVLARTLEGAQLTRDALTGRLERVERRDRDGITGFRTGGFLERYTRGAGPGTLPVMLLLLRVQGLDGLREQHGTRSEVSVLTQLSRILHGPLTDVDHAVRLGAEEFLLVMPARRPTEAAAVQQAVHRAADVLPTVFPFVPLPTTSVLTHTRDRPLPLAAMYDALRHAERDGEPMTAFSS